MNVLTAKELQRRLARSSPLSSRIVVTSLNPGSVQTEGVYAYASRASVGPFLSPLYTLIARLWFADPVWGAYVYMFGACAREVREERVGGEGEESLRWEGAYLQPPGKMGKASEQGCDEGLARELWDTTERFLESIGIVLPPVELEESEELVVRAGEVEGEEAAKANEDVPPVTAA